MVLVCLTGQQTHQTWTPKRIYGVLSRGKWETRDQKMQMSWRPLSKKPGLPYHLSSATPNWGSNYSKRSPYKVLSTYTVNEHTFQKANSSQKKNVLLVLWSILICWESELVGCQMWAKIITIKRTKDLNYFSLCAYNLFNTWVSQFELNYWNKLFHDILIYWDTSVLE